MSVHNKTGLLDRFAHRFGHPGRLFRAPGRINIIGEHCDYNDGFVMPLNIALYTWLAISAREDDEIHVDAGQHGSDVFVLDSLSSKHGGGWREYIKGVLWALSEAGHPVLGANVMIEGEIPIGGGLSSSASLEAVLAYALLRISDIEPDRQEMALLCRKAENDFVGVPCGIMDQFVICMGEQGSTLKLDCRSLGFDSYPLPEQACFMVIHSGVNHSLGDGAYQQRLEQCAGAVEVIAKALPEVHSLRDASAGDLNAADLGDVLHKRARHVVSEIERVDHAAAALQSGDDKTLGRLINASHDSLRDDYEVSCAEVDLLVDLARAQTGVLGARMVGGGFGGCVLVLAENEQAMLAMKNICAAYEAKTGIDPWRYIVAPAGFVEEVSTA